MPSNFPVLPDDQWYVCSGPSTVTYIEVPAGASGDTGQPDVEAFDTQAEALARAIELGLIPGGSITASVLTVDAPSTEIKWADTADISFESLLLGARILFSDPFDAIAEGAVCLSKNAETGITVWDSEVQLEGDDIPFSITYENKLVIGTLFTGRGSGLGPEDLNVSYYTAYQSSAVPQEDTELYVPGTDTVIAYGSGPGPDQFDSFGNCFAPGDYLMQIRQASTGFLIAEFEVPLAPAGVDVPF